MALVQAGTSDYTQEIIKKIEFCEGFIASISAYVIDKVFCFGYTNLNNYFKLHVRIALPLCARLNQNDKKMRPSITHFQGFQNGKNYQKMHQILKFHDGLQTFLLTSAGRAALLGRSAGTGQQVSLKAILVIQNFSF